MLEILKDIWTTGEIKDTYDLDLNWPQSKENNHSEIRKTNENDKFTEESKQSDKKFYWIIGGFIFLAFMGLIVWLIFRKKKN